MLTEHSEVDCESRRQPAVSVVRATGTRGSSVLFLSRVGVSDNR
jgi:hypothetical protein